MYHLRPITYLWMDYTSIHVKSRNILIIQKSLLFTEKKHQNCKMNVSLLCSECKIVLSFICFRCMSADVPDSFAVASGTYKMCTVQSSPPKNDPAKGSSLKLLYQ